MSVWGSLRLAPISRLIARCDINTYVSSCASLLDGAPSRLLRMQKRLPDRKKRVSLFGQTGKAKDIRKVLVLSFPVQNSKTASVCLGLTFSYPICKATSQIKAESAIVRRSYIASSPYRKFSLWLRHQLTFLSVSVHSRTLTNSHIGYVPDPFPSVTQRI